MSLQTQRFCPLCDRPFTDGEAVLRCEGCGVMHHPSCWVSKGGCATKESHKSTPIALAYSTERPSGAPAPHPGEGTRVMSPPPLSPAGREPIALRPRAESQAGPPADLPDEGVVIGAPPPAQPPPPVGLVRGPGATTNTYVPPTVTPPPAPKRFAAAPADAARKPMPQIYGHRRWLSYWYIPAAIIVAILVAGGVIWLAGLFLDDGDDTPSASPTQQPGDATSPAGSDANPTAAPGNTPAAETPGAGGTFRAGDIVVVTGTDTGGDDPGCLNVRTAPGTDNPIIVCAPEGTELTVLGGPQPANDLTWWNLKLESGDGWAAETYLKKKP